MDLWGLPKWPHRALRGLASLGPEPRTGQGHGGLVPITLHSRPGGLVSSVLPKGLGPGQLRSPWVGDLCLLRGMLYSRKASVKRQDMVLAARASGSPRSASHSAPEAREHEASPWSQSSDGPGQGRGLGATGSALPCLCLGCASHSSERGWAAGAQGRKGVMSPTACSLASWGDPVLGVPGAFWGLVCGWSLGCPG